MKNILLFALAFLTSYFLVHSLSDGGITFIEAYTTIIIGGLTFLTFVAFKLKRS